MKLVIKKTVNKAFLKCNKIIYSDMCCNSASNNLLILFFILIRKMFLERFQEVLNQSKVLKKEIKLKI